MTEKLKAGAAREDITPGNSQFLYGYPHVKRYSTGVHDRLWSSALCLAGKRNGPAVMFIANDLIYITRDMTDYIRRQVCRRTGMKPEHIMVTATHTHSGPKTADNPAHKADPAVPETDREYVRFIQERMVKSALRAHANIRPAKIGFAIADAAGTGANRRDPAGPADLEAPVLLVRDLNDKNIACMLVCSMHPTVLHEDSTLVSGDFPGLARLYLQNGILGTHCPVLHHTGPAGNQSPRHVTTGNTFGEAERLGRILGRSVERAVGDIEFSDCARLGSARVLLEDLPRRRFPPVEEAREKLERAAERLAVLRESRAPAPQVRTAECDWFGAENNYVLAQSAADGTLERYGRKCLPAEIQLLSAGQWNFVGWPGESFVEYALEVKRQCPRTSVIAYANGHLNGYIVTKEAAAQGGYEASTAMFGWETGGLFVEKTLELIRGSL